MPRRAARIFTARKAIKTTAVKKAVTRKTPAGKKLATRKQPVASGSAGGAKRPQLGPKTMGQIRKPKARRWKPGSMLSRSHMVTLLTCSSCRSP